ncbi:Six-hairpin glycosidase [Aspergillus pseudodeflectus]|uniref:Six-hairpin glycosidase n=1 Tax=Aspergillus pseudodeflectus TaxID=176178 RepID=A0ABR4K733_9EURO
MSATVFDRTWMWHPDFHEDRTDTAGLLVHFKRTINITGPLPTSLPIQITADTRYKLYVNQQFVTFGPVKGDQNLWFYDEVDIAPFLRTGENHLAVIVLRFFHATQYAPSFPRLTSGGLRIVAPEAWAEDLQSSESWEAAIDPWTVFRIDEPEDRFLHVYEKVSGSAKLEWKPAKLLEFRVSTGNSAPWHLSPRLIPTLRIEQIAFSAVHNCDSSVPLQLWEKALLGSGLPLCLPPGSTHQLDLEVPFHTTAFVEAVFERVPEDATGNSLTLTYAESYEDTPIEVPDIRRKGQRCDDSKSLFGPRDIYEMNAPSMHDSLRYTSNPKSTVVVRPFHWRTFRFIRVNITVGSHPLVLNELTINKVNYPLQRLADVDPPDTETKTLWDISIRTLENCMHDCYEDCPFYEQLQYAMDVRSSVLFTYYVSGDDRMARQAIIQLRNSFQARAGLTLSRSPTHRPQIIPHFSLFWILTVYDHVRFFGDSAFTKESLPIIEAVLSFFDNKIDPAFGLVKLEDGPGLWNFIDWAQEWKPHGLNPVVVSTGISTYTNNLYAHTLTNVAAIMSTLGLHHRVEEYRVRAESIVNAIRKHCFTGTLFTDTVASAASTAPSSQHAQVWSVLSGAATGNLARDILQRSLSPDAPGKFIRASTAMSFYTARALSLAGGSIYDSHFHTFWEPWRAQIKLGLTTWQEDDVSCRSDCHAWGSAPIYEFAGEVAGLSPVEPGWAVVGFAPRVGLYRRFKAMVPVPTALGMAVARVLWDVIASGDVQVDLEFKWVGGERDCDGDGPLRAGPPAVSVLVRLPGQDDVRLDGVTRAAFVVNSAEVRRFDR